MIYKVLGFTALAALAYSSSVVMNNAKTDGALQSLPIETAEETLISRPSILSPEIGQIAVKGFSSQDVAILRRGMDALTNKNIDLAIAIRDSLPMADIDRQILSWAIAISGQPAISHDELSTSLVSLSHWPSLTNIQANKERALLRDNPSADEIVSSFTNSPPTILDSKIALANAYNELGNKNEAIKIVRESWLDDTLSSTIEDKLLATFKTDLSVDDYRKRMSYLLYRDKVEQAKRFSELGDAQSLYEAWVAVKQRLSTAKQKLAAVTPQLQLDPAYLFVKITDLRRSQDYDAANALIVTAPNDAAQLIYPEAWWNERRIIARAMADKGEYSQAYAIAANHTATSPADIADAEFHSGWYAFRKLNQFDKAEAHFKKMLDVSTGPLSVSRANYWLGRVYKEQNRPESTTYFEQAAKFGTTYYGQLARDELQQATPYASSVITSKDNESLFYNNELVRTILRLEAADYGWRAQNIYRYLATQKLGATELSLLIERAEARYGHQFALQLGKVISNNNPEMAILAFPLGVIPNDADIDKAGQALAYAIARQESGFNIAAISPANAHGLLQILPNTAKDTAKRLGIEFTADKLTTDAAYNATLGSHYLAEQIDKFDGSYILTFIAYNAGPKRAPEWITRYGDPRGKSLYDVIDWVERIPFPETRNYVQRVMENYQVYKSILKQDTSIAIDLTKGRS